MTIQLVGLRKPSNIVPRRALNVFLHTLQRERCRVRSWITIVPIPFWPLAEHCAFGQNTFDGSIGSDVLFGISTSCQDPSFFSIHPPSPHSDIVGELPLAAQIEQR